MGFSSTKILLIVLLIVLLISTADRADFRSVLCKHRPTQGGESADRADFRSVLCKHSPTQGGESRFETAAQHWPPCPSNIGFPSQLRYKGDTEHWVPLSVQHRVTFSLAI